MQHGARQQRPSLAIARTHLSPSPAQISCELGSASFNSNLSAGTRRCVGGSPHKPSDGGLPPGARRALRSARGHGLGCGQDRAEHGADGRPAVRMRGPRAAPFEGRGARVCCRTPLAPCLRPLFTRIPARTACRRGRGLKVQAFKAGPGAPGVRAAAATRRRCRRRCAFVYLPLRLRLHHRAAARSGGTCHRLHVWDGLSALEGGAERSACSLCPQTSWTRCITRRPRAAPPSTWTPGCSLGSRCAAAGMLVVVSAG